jgi:hypothetical protein
MEFSSTFRAEVRPDRRAAAAAGLLHEELLVALCASVSIHVPFLLALILFVASRRIIVPMRTRNRFPERMAEQEYQRLKKEQEGR